MPRIPYYLIAALFLLTAFSPFVQTSEDSNSIPLENIHLVDKRLQLAFKNPESSESLGLAPAPEGKISLFAQVESLGDEHHTYVEDLGGEVTSSFSRFDTFGFLLPIGKVPEVTYLPVL